MVEFRPIRRTSPDRLRSTVWGAGHSIWTVDASQEPAVANIRVSEEMATDGVTRVLELGTDARVWVRRRQYLIANRPVQLAASYFPAEIVANSAIIEVHTGSGGVYARLRELGYEPTQFREEIRVRMSTNDERETLELTQDTPVAEITRTAYTASGRPVEMNRMVLNAEAYVLEYKFTS